MVDGDVMARDSCNALRILGPPAQSRHVKTALLGQLQASAVRLQCPAASCTLLGGDLYNTYSVLFVHPCSERSIHRAGQERQPPSSDRPINRYRDVFRNIICPSTSVSYVLSALLAARPVYTNFRLSTCRNMPGQAVRHGEPRTEQATGRQGWNGSYSLSHYKTPQKQHRTLDSVPIAIHSRQMSALAYPPHLTTYVIQRPFPI